MSAGIVYILSNAAMPGYVKIGLTQQNDVMDRVKQLDNTSVPVPFECVYAARVPDCRRLERTLHFVFGESRARRSREFFTINADLAKAIIELVAEQEFAFTDAEQSIDAGERKEIEEHRKRREVRTFPSLSIPLGSELAFTKDENITCIVSGARKVNFQGEQLSPSAAALRVVNGMGYDWKAVSGMEYWMFNGVRLSDIGASEEVDQDEALD